MKHINSTDQNTKISLWCIYCCCMCTHIFRVYIWLPCCILDALNRSHSISVHPSDNFSNSTAVWIAWPSYIWRRWHIYPSIFFIYIIGQCLLDKVELLSETCLMFCNLSYDNRLYNSICFNRQHLLYCQPLDVSPKPWSTLSLINWSH